MTTSSPDTPPEKTSQQPDPRLVFHLKALAVLLVGLLVLVVQLQPSVVPSIPKSQHHQLVSLDSEGGNIISLNTTTADRLYTAISKNGKARRRLQATSNLPECTYGANQVDGEFSTNAVPSDWKLVSGTAFVFTSPGAGGTGWAACAITSGSAYFIPLYLYENTIYTITWTQKLPAAANTGQFLAVEVRSVDPVTGATLATVMPIVAQHSNSDINYRQFQVSFLSTATITTGILRLVINPGTSGSPACIDDISVCQSCPRGQSVTPAPAAGTSQSGPLTCGMCGAGYYEDRGQCTACPSSAPRSYDGSPSSAWCNSCPGGLLDPYISNVPCTSEYCPVFYDAAGAAGARYIPVDPDRKPWTSTQWGQCDSPRRAL